MSSFDVLVVGAGPSGLIAAAELARHGLRIRVIDKNPTPKISTARPSKAIGLNARSLEIFDDIGVLKPILKSGVKVYNMNFYADDRRVVQIAMDELDSPYPFILNLPQYEVERHLRQYAIGLGVTIDFETELMDLSLHERWVSAKLAHRGQIQQEIVPWLLACDGVLSTIRRNLEIPLEFEGPDRYYALTDIRLKWDQSADESHIFLSSQGVVNVLPLPMEDYWRILIPCGEKALPEALPLSFFESKIEERVGRPIAIREPRWIAGLRVRQRRLAHFRHERVFFVGDSAHNHSPFGGQGMNAGIQDAYNLAWKLALVVKGLGHSGLLDSYHHERNAAAREMAFHSSRLTRAVTLRHPISKEIRAHLASFLSTVDIVRQRVARGFGELHQHYRESPIVAEDRPSLLEASLFTDRSVEQPSLLDWRDFGAGPRAGDRAPNGQCIVNGKASSLFEEFRGTLHTLLLFDGQAPTEEGYIHLNDLAKEITRRYHDRVRVLIVIPNDAAPASLKWTGPVVLDAGGELHHIYGAGAECLYMIRPDGYIGYRCQPASGPDLKAYLDQLFKG